MELDWKSILGAVVPAVIAWFLNERQKRADRITEEKVKRYDSLIYHLKYFGEQYATDDYDNRKANQFIGDLQLSWMYCSDEVIKKAYELLKEMDRQFSIRKIDQQIINNMKGKFVLAIRNDLLKSRKIIKWPGNSTKLEPKHLLDISFSHNIKSLEFSAFARESITPRVIIDNKPRLEKSIGAKIPTGFNSLDELYVFFKDVNIERISSESSTEGTEHKLKILIRPAVAPNESGE